VTTGRYSAETGGGDLRAPPAGSVQARSSLTALVSKAVSER
jgi:hypothetical protein